MDPVTPVNNKRKAGCSPPSSSSLSWKQHRKMARASKAATKDLSLGELAPSQVNSPSTSPESSKKGSGKRKKIKTKLLTVIELYPLHTLCAKAFNPHDYDAPQAFTDRFQELVKAGEDVHAVDPDGNNILHVAAKSGILGCTEVLEFLKDKEIDKDAKNDDSKTALRIIYEETKGNDRFSLMKKFIEYFEPDQEVEDAENNTLLVTALLNNELQVARLMLETGACAGDYYNDEFIFMYFFTNSYSKPHYWDVVELLVEKDGHKALEYKDYKWLYLDAMKSRNSTKESFLFNSCPEKYEDDLRDVYANFYEKGEWDNDSEDDSVKGSTAGSVKGSGDGRVEDSARVSVENSLGGSEEESDAED